MKPIPVAFHIGPLEVHTYGIGLAVTFWFAYRYFERRLARNGYPTDWVVGMFLWVILMAVVGARALHVVSNLGDYSSDPWNVFAVWQGGLSSFGGLLFAVPTGVVLQRRRCPQLSTARALDLVAPVLLAAWALGRLLGPQLMYAGGGGPSHAWYCMYYTGLTGCRVPVPIFQSLEDASVYVILILLERRLRRWPDGTPRTNHPAGAVLGVAMVLWGVERTVDEHVWLAGVDGQLGSDLVQVAGILLVVGGAVLLAITARRWRRWLAAGSPGGHEAEGDADHQGGTDLDDSHREGDTVAQAAGAAGPPDDRAADAVPGPAAP